MMVFHYLSGENAMPASLTIAKNDQLALDMLSNLVNRHGCITGATGTGKTVTLQKIAQSLSEIGVPVFMADVKGDLSGIAKAGALSEKMAKRLEALKLEAPQWAGCPVTFWDVYGQQGHPVRATVSDLGPLLLARMLNLNDTQEGVLQLVFRIADDNGLLLLDTKDMRAMLQQCRRQRGRLQNQLRQHQRGQHRRDSAWPDRDRRAGRRPVFRRTDAQHRRPAANRRQRQGRGQHPVRRQADERAAPVRGVPAVDAVRAV
jgi:hypothetical protein